MAGKQRREDYDLAKALEAVEFLKRNYADAFADDPDLATDMIEGSTDLFDVVERMVESIAEDEALVEACKILERNQADRRRRVEKRATMKRALVLTALQTAEVRKREFPVGTVSLSRVSGKPIVTEEADVPSVYFDEPPRPAPVLIAAGLWEAWKARVAGLTDAEKIPDAAERAAALHRVNDLHPAIPGTAWDNGGETLSIRFK